MRRPPIANQTRGRKIHGCAGKHASVEDRRLYQVWLQLRQRCGNPTNKDFKHYGALGVNVHAPWEVSFDAFRRYISRVLGPKPTPEHSLDRIDPTRGYVPGNLRWATRAEQARNQRRHRETEAA